MNRAQAIRYIAYCVDDALSERKLEDVPWHLATLVGWNRNGFQPLFVAVWSCLDVKLEPEEAKTLAQDLLQEKQWFSDEPTEPDFIL